MLAVVALAVVGVRSFTREKVEIRVAAVNHQNLLSTVSTNGRVEPVEYFQAHAPAPGVVAKLYVEVGQKVKAGDLLVKMDDADTVARLATASSTLESAQLNQQNLQQSGSQEERLALQADLSRAEMRRSRLRPTWPRCISCSRRERHRLAEVASAEQRLQEATSLLSEHAVRGTQRYSPGDHARAQAQLTDATGSRCRCAQ